ncbi:MAG TPA: LON peptidase substrate-binding domain-containing protein, partial [Vicinamibacteria bacterium]|nr:LON peptidase substrate-binding domain-containing protein [Vicinamibacteria bacterium]
MDIEQRATQGNHEIHRGVPILPLRDTVIFPQSILPLAVGRDATVKLLNENAESADFIGVVTQRDAAIESPAASDLNRVGTSVRIHKSVRMPDGSIRLVVQGGFRFRILKVTQVSPYIRADVETLPSVFPPEDAIEVDALSRNVHSVFSKVVEMSPQLADEVGSLAATLNDPGRLADFIAQNLPSLDTDNRQKVLETARVRDRLKTVHEALLRELEVLEVGNKIESQVK